MRQFFRNGIALCCVLLFSACSTKQAASVLDDISRDTYDKNRKKQRMENIANPNYAAPPTYDQYQKERQETLSDP